MLSHNGVELDAVKGKGAASVDGGKDNVWGDEGAATKVCEHVLQGDGVRVALVPHLYWWARAGEIGGGMGVWRLGREGKRGQE